MFPAGPRQNAQDQSLPRQTSTASTRSQCSPPVPNSEPRVRAFPRRTSTASAIAAFPAGPEKQAQDQSVPRQINCKRQIEVFPAKLERQAQVIVFLDRIRVFPARPQLRAPGELRIRVFQPDLNHKEFPKIYQIESQKEFQKICQKDCQKICQIGCQKECCVYNSGGYEKE